MSGEKKINPADLGLNVSGKTETNHEKQLSRLEILREAQALSLDIPREGIREIKRQIEEKYGLSLKDRDEAHMTLIRTAQMRILHDGLITAEDLATFDSCVNQPVEIVGVGTLPEGLDAAGVQTYLEQERQAELVNPKKNKPKGVVFFAVIRVPAEVQTRLDALIDAFNAKESNPKKHLPKTEPHVTIGFTLKDRFDGSKKAVNRNVVVDIPAMSFEAVAAQVTARDDSGNRIMGADGNETYRYEFV
jgi:hypothetical protein